MFLAFGKQMHIIDKIPVLTELPEALEKDSQICNKGKLMVGEAHNNLTKCGLWEEWSGNFFWRN